ncbi:MAG: iron-containing alcohol dehydrogenase [Microthrixaceae bacterium]
MSVVEFSFPTTIRFGTGAAREVAPRLIEAGLTRPLIVTDPGVSALPIHARLAESLQSAGLAAATFDGIRSNPVIDNVSAGVASFRDHQADCVVGLGGGAALDVAKAIALMATHPGELLDYEDEVPGARPIDHTVAPLFALPTTAGTGSEVGRSAVISDEHHIKRIIYSPHLLPRVVFADPLLTADLPAHLTAATGLDALTHNVEAYLSPHFHPMCDGIAIEGVRLCAANLESAVADGTDMDARSAMLMASMMGAVAFQKGLGLVHSCAHALGTAVDLHHGLANGLMIDHALRFNIDSAGDKMTHLATVIGLPDPNPEHFLSWLGTLKASVGVSANLAEHGLDAGLAGELVGLALADPCHANNPAPVTEADFVEVFDRAFS